jgi:hypothetical protein
VTGQNVNCSLSLDYGEVVQELYSKLANEPISQPARDTVFRIEQHKYITPNIITFLTQQGRERTTAFNRLQLTSLD